MECSYSFLPKWWIHQIMLPSFLAMVIQRNKWRLRIMIAKKLMTFWKLLLLWIMLTPGEIIKWIYQVKLMPLFSFFLFLCSYELITNFNIQPSAFLTLIPFINFLIITGTRTLVGLIFKMPPHKCEMCDKRSIYETYEECWCVCWTGYLLHTWRYTWPSE